MEINTSKIYEAVYNLCQEANLRLPLDIYNSFQDKEILANAYFAFKNQTPLCQDCGQVLIFLKISQDVSFKGEFIEDAINKAVEQCYKDCFFRKSVVKNSLQRENTTTNTPCIIYSEFAKIEGIEINLLIKGGGAENMSFSYMFNPTTSKEEILNYINEEVNKRAENCCPPLFLGIGIGGTLEYSGILSKKALFEGEKIELKNKFIKNAKILISQTHIASMPVSVTINCHSNRHAKCLIKNNKIDYFCEKYIPKKVEITQDYPKINATETQKIKDLKEGQKILLSGTIYTARDEAHKRLIKMIDNHEKLPFDLKNSIIFYAGPAPKREDKKINSIGPTTAKRMDKFTPKLYENGLLATIGKGERNKQTKETIKKYNGKYFTIRGGIASFVATKIKKIEAIAFKELGTEAIYQLEVEDLMLEVAF